MKTYWLNFKAAVVILMVLTWALPVANAQTNNSADELYCVREASTPLRIAPDAGAKPIESVYANTLLDVLDIEGGWLKIKFNKGIEGWIKRSSTTTCVQLVPSEDGLKLLHEALSQRSLGSLETAHDLLMNVVDGFPDTYASYEAARYASLGFAVVPLVEPIDGFVPVESLARVPSIIALMEEQW